MERNTGDQAWQGHPLSLRYLLLSLQHFLRDWLGCDQTLSRLLEIDEVARLERRPDVPDLCGKSVYRRVGLTGPIHVLETKYRLHV